MTHAEAKALVQRAIHYGLAKAPDLAALEAWRREEKRRKTREATRRYRERKKHD